jgi:MFS family permease
MDTKRRQESKRLVRRFDSRILPLLTSLYFFAFINRANIANIHTEVVRDLLLSESQFGWAVTIFFFGYTLLQIPSNISLQRFGAHRWLALLALSWGVISMLMALSRSFADLMIYRALLGACQAGIFPGSVLYLTFWYRPEERGLRMGTFFSASIFASSVAGLLAYSLLQLDDVGGLRGWQWLLLVEGVPSVLISGVCYLLLPPSPRQCVWLSEGELRLAYLRLQSESLGAVAIDDGAVASNSAGIDDDDDDENSEQGPLLISTDIVVNISTTSTSTATTTNVDDDDDDNYYKQTPAKDDTNAPGRAVRSPLLWFLAILYFMLVCPFLALNTFLPKIVELFGVDSVLANLITAPIYLLCTATTLLITRNSDRWNERPWHLISCCLLIALGFLGLAAFTPVTGWLVSTSPPDNYSTNVNIGQLIIPLLFSQLAITGAAPVIPLSATWVTSLIPREDRQLLTIGTAMVTSVGQLSGWLVPMLYAFIADLNYQQSRLVNNDNENNVLNYNWAHFTMAAVALLAALAILLFKLRFIRPNLVKPANA